MQTRLGSVVVVLMLLAGVMALPAGAAASGPELVVEWDASVPVGVDAFVGGVAPEGATGVRVEVLDQVDGWVESDTGVIEADGGFEVLLSSGADVVGVSTFRVVVDTADGEVYSDEFTVTRTSPPTDSDPAAPDESETPVEPDETPEEPVESEEPVEPEETPSEPKEPEDSRSTDEPETPAESEALEEPLSTSEQFSTLVADPVTVSAASAGSKVVGALTYVWGSVNGHVEDEVFTEVYLEGAWVPSEAAVSDATGWYTIPLTYGADTAGVYTYRVGATTPDGVVYSNEFTLTRTAPVVTVSAASAGTKQVGLLTYVWGRVDGYTGGQVFTEVLVGGSWSRSQTRTSDSTGYYQIPLTYGANTPGTYTWRVGAVTPGGTVYSESFTLTRTPRPVTVSASSAGSKVVGALTYTWGRVSGYTRGQVFTEVMTSNGWSRSQTRTTAASGYFQIPLTYGANTPGTYTWRVGAVTPGGTVYSNTFTLTRTPRPRPPVGALLDCSTQPSGKAVVVDKVAQRLWLCNNGAAVSGVMPFTSGPTYQAPRGVYRVYFKRNPWWSAGGRYRLDNFTGFAVGVNGDRIGFHKYVIMQEYQVGTEAWRNRSGGCFRLRSRDAATVYQFADYGTIVRILNNG